MDAICQFCGAKHWLAEQVSGSACSPMFSCCCHRGKVVLPPLPAPPLAIHSLITDQTSQVQHFRRHIRQYNLCFTFTSFRASDNNIIHNGHGPWIWKTGYQIYHSAGSLLPSDGEQPSYAQLYFYNADNAIRYRKRHNPNLRRELLDIIQQSLYECNPFSKVFLHARNVLHRLNSGSLAIQIVADPQTDQHQYNAPTVNEIAVLIVRNEQDVNGGRDIILQPHDGGLQRISDLHSAYAPLHYVLLFPLGTAGWNPNLTLQTTDPKRMTQVQFYSYCLHLRDTDFPSLHIGGRLFQQYICDI